MSLREDISHLRGLLTKTPDDPLFQHLSDLISALDDACSSTTSKIKRNCERKSLKVKRKIKRPHDKIDLSTGNVGGSESNVEEFGKLGLVSAEGTVEMTDSENELCKRRYSNPWSSIPHCNGAGSSRNLKATTGQRSSTTTTGLPIESDSFTETFTPARKFRRKRLIKRMAVDTCVDEEPTGNVRFRCNSASMDVELAGGALPTSSTRYLFASKRRMLRKTGSCHSESSMECDLSSDDTSDTDCEASDEGHQGDDEQSDWYFEITKSAANKQQQASSSSAAGVNSAGAPTHDECVMGVPNIRKMLMRRMSRDQAIGLNQYMQTIESSDTDMSQSSNSLKFSSKNFGRRLMSKNAPSMSSALNKRIVNFLHHNGESEVQLGTLKKRERKIALRLASFYNLDVRCKTSKGYQTYTLLKTKYTVA